MQAPARPQPQGGAGAEPQPRAAAQQLGLEHLLQQEELVRGMGKGGGVSYSRPKLLQREKQKQSGERFSWLSSVFFLVLTPDHSPRKRAPI